MIAGYTQSTDHDVSSGYISGNSDTWIVKTDSSGNIEWETNHGDSGDDRVLDIELTDDGGYIYTGFSYYDDNSFMGNHGSDDMLLAKLSPTGMTEWVNLYGGSLSDIGYDIEQTAEGGYISVGTSKSIDGDIRENNGDSDIWVTRFDESGNLTDSYNYGDGTFDGSYTFVYDGEGEYTIAAVIIMEDAEIQEITGPVAALIFHGKAEYRIQFDEMQGTVVNDSKGFYGTIISEFPVPEKEGYSFNGWFTDKYFTEERVAPYQIQKDDTFYARWARVENVNADIEWTDVTGGSSIDGYLDVCHTVDGGELAVGITMSGDGIIGANQGGSDLLAVKYDPIGNIEWSRTFGGSGNDIPGDVILVPDGGYLVAGSTDSSDGDVTSNRGFSDSWIIRLDASGNKLWQKTFGGSSNDTFQSAILTDDGGFLLAGSSGSSDGDLTGNNGNSDFWILKTDSVGNLIWQKNYGGSRTEVLNQIISHSEGGYFAAGYSNSEDGDVTGGSSSDDYWVIRLDDSGNLVWEKSFVTGSNDSANAITQVDGGDVVIAGQSESDYRVIRIDTEGNVLWDRSYGGSGTDSAEAIYYDYSGMIVVAGNTESNKGDIRESYGGKDFWVLKLDGEGNPIGQNTFGGSQSDYGLGINISPDYGFAFVGYTNSNDIDVSANYGLFDCFIVRADWKHEVEFRENGGSSVFNVTEEAGSVIPVSPITIRVGYEFAGWYTDSGYTTLAEFPYPITGDSILYASWIPVEPVDSRIIWRNIFGSSGEDTVYDAIKTSDGGYLLTGTTATEEDPITQQLVVKFSPGGSVEWSKAFGGSTGEYGIRIMELQDGNIIALGASLSTDGTFSYNIGSLDITLMKLDSTGNIIFQKTYGTSDVDDVRDIVRTADGGFLIAGNIMVSDFDVTHNYGGFDMWFLKVDSDGNKEWQKTIGGSGDDIVTDIELTGDGGYIVAAYSDSNTGFFEGNQGNDDFWLLKLDDNCNVDWKISQGNENYENRFSVTESSDGGYIAAGCVTGYDDTNVFLTDVQVIKTDSEGEVEWTSFYGGSRNEVVKDIIETKDGNFIIAGSSTNGHDDLLDDSTEMDAWVFMLNKEGDLIGQNLFGGSGFDEAISVIQDGDEYFIAMQTSSDDGDSIGNHGEQDILIVKTPFPHNLYFDEIMGGQVPDINEMPGTVIEALPQLVFEGYEFEGWYEEKEFINGPLSYRTVVKDETIFVRWSRTESDSTAFMFSEPYGGSYLDGFYGIDKSEDGTFILAGQVWSPDGDVSSIHSFYWPDAWLVKTDSRGSIIWERAFGGVLSDGFKDVKATPDGGYIAVGSSRSYNGDVSENNGSYDFWIVKTDAAGNIIWEKSYGGSGYDAAGAVELAPDGGFVIAGQSDSSDGDVNGNSGNDDFWVIKVDSAGDLVWKHSFGGSQDETVWNIRITDNGQYLVAGSTSSDLHDTLSPYSGGEDIVAFLVDSEGVHYWRTIGGTGDDVGYDAMQTEDGGYLILGSREITRSGDIGEPDYASSDYYLTKLNWNFTVAWNKDFGGSGTDVATGFEKLDNGNYLISGYSDSDDGDVTGNIGGLDFWVIEVDDNFGIVHQDNYGGILDDYAYDLHFGDDIFTIAGYTYSNDIDVLGNNGLADGMAVSAQWAVSVEFETNGGSFIGGLTIPYGMEASSLPVILKPGYTFDGWYLDELLTVGPVTAYTFYDDTTLFAKWSAEEFDSLYLTETIVRGGSNPDLIIDIEKTSDGGYIAGGTSSSYDGSVPDNKGGYDFWIYKTDASGNIEWSKTFGGSSLEYLYDLEQTDDGGYIAAGYTDSADGDVGGNLGKYDGWVIKLGYTGDVEWKYTYGGGGIDKIKDIEQTPDGGYVFAGDTTTEGNVFGDWWIVKVDALGNQLWERRYGEIPIESAEALDVTDGGDILIAGYKTDGENGLEDFWIARMDSSGNMLWDYEYGRSGTDIAYDIEATEDGGMIAVGSSVNNGSGDIWLLKLNASGISEWNTLIGGSDEEIALDVKIGENGQYYIAGYSKSLDGDVPGNNGGIDIFIAVVDSNGNYLAGQNLGTAADEGAYSIDIIPNEGFIASGIVADDAFTLTGDFQFEIAFDENLGSEVENMEIPAGNRLESLPVPVRPGFDFVGWYYDAGLTIMAEEDDIVKEHTTLFGGWENNESENPVITWSGIFGEDADEQMNDMVLTDDGGTVSVGFTESDGNGKRDMMVVRTDGNGNVVWQSLFGGSEDDEAFAIEKTSGGYVVAGYTESPDGDVSGYINYSDMWILKINETGDLLWQKVIGGFTHDIFDDLRILEDGSIIAVGHSNSHSLDPEFIATNGQYDCVAVKMDFEGNVIWVNNYGGSLDEKARAVDVDSNGNIHVLCETRSDDMDVSGNNGLSDYWLLKLDSDGNLISSRTYGGISTDYPRDLLVTDSGVIIMAGSAGNASGDVSANNGNSDAWILAVDANGDVIWDVNRGGQLNDSFRDIEMTPDGKIIAVGYEYQSVFNADMLLACFGLDGELIWEKKADYSRSDLAMSVKTNEDTDLFVLGLYGYYDDVQFNDVDDIYISNTIFDWLLIEMNQKEFLNFNTNGGDDLASQFYDNGDTVVLLPEATKTGAYFAGWYTEPELINAVELPIVIDGDMTLFAAWDIKIAFELNGGAGIEEMFVPLGSVIDTLPNAWKNGYRLQGWFLDEGLTIEMTTPCSFISNTTLYAKWTVAPIPVTPIIPVPDDNGSDVILTLDDLDDDSDTGRVDIDLKDKGDESITVSINGDGIRNLADNETDLLLETSFVTVVVRISDDDISRILEKSGLLEEELGDIKVLITITTTDSFIGNPVAGPVDIRFRVILSDGEELEIKKFSRMNIISFELPDGHDTGLTGVVINSDGNPAHIPSEIVEKNGKKWIELKSFTNSVYMVIENYAKVGSAEGHWSEATVNNMASRLIIQNINDFEPDTPITRGRFAEYVTKALGIYRSGIYKPMFTDVSWNNDFADEITTASEYGIILGYPDGTFGPEDLITREEAMLMFARAIALIRMDIPDKSVMDKFLDASEVSEWAFEGVDIVTRIGVFNGRAVDELAPQGMITYSEAAQAIQNLLKAAELID